MGKPELQDGSDGDNDPQQKAYPGNEESIIFVNEPTRWRRFLASAGKAMIELGETMMSRGQYESPLPKIQD